MKTHRQESVQIETILLIYFLGLTWIYYKNTKYYIKHKYAA